MPGSTVFTPTNATQHIGMERRFGGHGSRLPWTSSANLRSQCCEVVLQSVDSVAKHFTPCLSLILAPFSSSQVSIMLIIRDRRVQEKRAGAPGNTLTSQRRQSNMCKDASPVVDLSVYTSSHLYGSREVMHSRPLRQF